VEFSLRDRGAILPEMGTLENPFHHVYRWTHPGILDIWQHYHEIRGRIPTPTG
jgi:hypothetical protein